MSTSVSSVSKHFPSAENGFTTTTSGSVSSAAVTVGLNSVAGYANGEVAVFVIDPGNSKKQTFTGTVDTSGSQVTGVVWTAGTNVAHDAGATVVDYASATHISMISKGILVQHKQDGTHADTITTDTINENTAANGVTIDGLSIKDSKLVTANSVVTANYTDESIVPEHLVASSGTSWPSVVWGAPISSGLSVGDGTVNYARSQQTGKKVRCRYGITFGSTTSMSALVVFALPAPSVTTYVANASPLGQAIIIDAGTAFIVGQVIWASATTVKLVANKSDTAFTYTADTDNTVPMTEATNDGIFVDFEYEAA